MKFSILNNIRITFFIIMSLGVLLIGGEVYFIVTNSQALDENTNEPPQNLSSGLYNSWVNEDTDEYKKMKAKGGILIDFDFDNDLDLYYGYNNSYYFENVGGNFFNITNSTGIDNEGLIGVVAGDVDNNGYPDILKQRYLDELSHNLIMNYGNHNFTTVEYLSPLYLPDIHGQGLLDADLDGDLDIIAIQDEGDIHVFLFLNQGLNPFGDPEFTQAFTFNGDTHTSSRTMSIVDFDNDGDQDVFVVRKFGINWMLENQTLTGTSENIVYNPNPNPFFVEVSQALGIDDEDASTSGSMGYGAAWGDYDNDEDFDLYIANWGINRLFQNESENFTNVIDETNTNADTLNNGVAWPDLDNDGDVELWVSNIRTRDDLFINDEEWNSMYSPDFLSATQDIVAGDYDNDGLLDIFTSGLEMNDNDDNDDDTTSAKYTSLLYNNITDDSTLIINNWIKIKLEGGKYGIDNNGWSILSNKSAIGARIKIHTDSGIQTREIIASKGHGSMDPLIQHFGLGSEYFVNGITVSWPSLDTLTNQPKQIYYPGPFDGNKIFIIVEHLGFVGNKGDSNLDYSIDVLDVVRTINEILIGNFLDEKEFWAVDMNYDKILNILDIVRLVEFLLSP